MINCPNCNAALTLSLASQPTPPVVTPPVVAPPVATPAGTRPRLVTLPWTVGANNRTQVLDIASDEAIICQFTTPSVDDTASLSIVHAPGYPEAMMHCVLGTLKDVTTTSAAFSFNVSAKAPSILAGILHASAIHLLPNTTHQLSITFRNPDGTPSLPAGKLGGINLDFQN